MRPPINEISRNRRWRRAAFFVVSHRDFGRFHHASVHVSPLTAGPVASGHTRRAPSSGENEKSDQAARPSRSFGSRQAEGILGRQVRSSADENMGRIVDIIVDRTGRTRAAVIDFGGFLGVGSRKIAVDWNAMRFAPGLERRDIVTLELTRDQVKAAPEYEDGQPSSSRRAPVPCRPTPLGFVAHG